MRSGARLGHGKVVDHMFLDGLEMPMNSTLMGTFAEDWVENINSQEKPRMNLL